MTLAERNDLIEQFRYLVPKTRQRVVPVVPWRVQAEDLEGEGYLALVRAADEFDPNRGSFRSWAICKIRASMLEYLRSEDWLPRSVRDWQKRLQRAEEALIGRGEEICWETLAGPLGVTETACEALWQLCYEPEIASLDQPVAEEQNEYGEPLTLKDTLADPAPGPEAQALERIEQQWAASIAGWLPYRERQAVQLTSERTAAWAAEQMGVSASRVAQLRSRGRRRLAGWRGIAETAA
jgi:RNA polymerase sigma factor FliA